MRWTEEQKRALAAELDTEKLTLEELGKRHGITRERVRQLLVSIGHTKRNWMAGHPKAMEACQFCGEEYPKWRGWTAHRAAKGHPPRHMTAESLELCHQVAEDYKSGMRIKTISAKYAMPYSEIYRRLRYLGLGPNRGGGRYVRTPKTIERMKRSKAAKTPATFKGWYGYAR